LASSLSWRREQDLSFGDFAFSFTLWETFAMSILIGPNTVASFHYTLRGEDSQIIDASEGAEPLAYLHGHHNIIPGLEKELVGLTVGAKKTVTVTPEEGYGVYNPKMIMDVPKEQFPKEAEIAEGEMFQLANEKGEVIMARIAKITDTTITLDANHPLAGQKLFFEIEIATVREATKEELDHGHVHGAGGHHHD
jgi:FKBP-type peptidyl-prolyl cis-trans isomerase SlyD